MNPASSDWIPDAPEKTTLVEVRDELVMDVTPTILVDVNVSTENVRSLSSANNPPVEAKVNLPEVSPLSVMDVDPTILVAVSVSVAKVRSASSTNSPPADGIGILPEVNAESVRLVESTAPAALTEKLVPAIALAPMLMALSISGSEASIASVIPVLVVAVIRIASVMVAPAVVSALSIKIAASTTPAASCWLMDNPRMLVALESVAVKSI